MLGFIDPHLHPFLGALLLQTNFITAMRWSLPGGETAEPVTSPEAYIERLKRLDRDLPPGEPLLTWGYHKIWHGDVDRAVLDDAVPNRPVVIWQRSFHVNYASTRRRCAGFRWTRSRPTGTHRWTSRRAASSRSVRR